MRKRRRSFPFSRTRGCTRPSETAVGKSRPIDARAALRSVASENSAQSVSGHRRFPLMKCTAGHVGLRHACVHRAVSAWLNIASFYAFFAVSPFARALQKNAQCITRSHVEDVFKWHAL